MIWQELSLLVNLPQEQYVNECVIQMSRDKERRKEIQIASLPSLHPIQYHTDLVHKRLKHLYSLCPDTLTSCPWAIVSSSDLTIETSPFKQEI